MLDFLKFIDSVFSMGEYNYLPLNPHAICTAFSLVQYMLNFVKEDRIASIFRFRKISSEDVYFIFNPSNLSTSASRIYATTFTTR